MFKKNKNEAPTVQGQLDSILLEMGTHNEGSEAWLTLLERYERVHKLLPDKKGKHVSADAIVAAAASLAGILIIVSYEHAHVIASKGLGFVTKLK